MPEIQVQAGPDPDGVIQPGPVEDLDDPIERLHAEALRWEGVAARAGEWLNLTRAALTEARAQRSSLIWNASGDKAELGRSLQELSRRIEELERTERVQAAHLEAARPQAEATAKAFAQAAERRAGHTDGEAGPDGGVARLCPVAGCLFEIHLPAPAGSRWQFAGASPPGDTPVVSVLAVLEPEGETVERLWRFRLRAERPGPAMLRFERRDARGAATGHVYFDVDITAEKLPGDG